MTHRLPLLVSLLIGLMQMGTTSTVFASTVPVEVTTKEHVFRRAGETLRRKLLPDDIDICCGFDDCPDDADDVELEFDWGSIKFKIECTGAYAGFAFFDDGLFGWTIGEGEESGCGAGFYYDTWVPWFELEFGCTDDSGNYKVGLEISGSQ